MLLQLLRCSSLLLGIMRNAAKVRPQVQQIIQMESLVGALASTRQGEDTHAHLKISLGNMAEVLQEYLKEAFFAAKHPLTLLEVVVCSTF